MRVHTHPGEILREEFMVPLELSATALAHALDVPPNRITAIIDTRHPRSITADTALRLARYFGTTPWLNLQSDYDLSVALKERGAQINNHVRPRPGAEAA